MRIETLRQPRGSGVTGTVSLPPGPLSQGSLFSWSEQGGVDSPILTSSYGSASLALCPSLPLDFCLPIASPQCSTVPG